MPVYICQCSVCGLCEDRLSLTGQLPKCSKCGGEVTKMPTFPAMVKIKGWGGYPSRRKLVKGTAPYSA